METKVLQKNYINAEFNINTFMPGLCEAFLKNLFHIALHVLWTALENFYLQFYLHSVHGCMF